MNIYQKINEVRKEVQYIKKDATVHGYRAVTHDMVTAKIRDSLIKHEIVIETSQNTSEITAAGETSKGTPIIRYSGWYTVSFVNCEKPDDRIVVKVEAHANDQGDKAPGKAMSYAVKYSMLKMFSLETGENEESRVEGDRKVAEAFEYFKRDLDDMLSTEDSLGLFMLGKATGNETWGDLVRSAPEGRKTAWKQHLREQVEIGRQMFVNINKGLTEKDNLLVKENMEDITETGKQYLARYLGKDVSAKLAGMLK